MKRIRIFRWLSIGSLMFASNCGFLDRLIGEPEPKDDGISCQFTDGTFSCDGGFDFTIPGFDD